MTVRDEVHSISSFVDYVLVMKLVESNSKAASCRLLNFLFLVKIDILAGFY